VDLFGRRRVFVASVALFTFASLDSGAAPSTTTQVTARAVQGIAAALVSPAALALPLAAFPSARKRIRTLGVSTLTTNTRRSSVTAHHGAGQAGQLVLATFLYASRTRRGVSYEWPSPG